MFTYVVFFILLSTGEWEPAFILEYSYFASETCKRWEVDKNRACYRISEL